MRTRKGFLTGTLAAAALTAPLFLHAQQQHPHPAASSRQAATLPPPSANTQAPAPVVRQAPTTPFNTGVQMSANPQAATGPRSMIGHGEHLNQWMSAHNNLSLPEQQAALEREPGFRELPPQTQQRMRDRLSQLSSMPPQQRQRMLERNEAMERLNPAQRAEVRSAMLQLGALPQDQRRVVSRAFRDLRGLPLEQRLPALNSQYRDLNPQQRLSLQQLMQVEPMLPPPDPAGPYQGGQR